MSTFTPVDLDAVLDNLEEEEEELSNLNNAESMVKPIVPKPNQDLLSDQQQNDCFAIKERNVLKLDENSVEIQSGVEEKPEDSKNDDMLKQSSCNDVSKEWSDAVEEEAQISSPNRVDQNELPEEIHVEEESLPLDKQFDKNKLLEHSSETCDLSSNQCIDQETSVLNGQIVTKEREEDDEFSCHQDKVQLSQTHKNALRENLSSLDEKRSNEFDENYHKSQDSVLVSITQSAIESKETSHCINEASNASSSMSSNEVDARVTNDLEALEVNDIVDNKEQLCEVDDKLRKEENDINDDDMNASLLVEDDLSKHERPWESSVLPSNQEGNAALTDPEKVREVFPMPSESADQKEEVVSPTRSESPPFQSIYKEEDEEDVEVTTAENQTLESNIVLNGIELSSVEEPICNGNSERREESMWNEVPPQWVPDDQAPVCMGCGVKFNLVKRRHHCRACGKVLCNSCCGEKAVLAFTEGKPARVCKPCKEHHEEFVNRTQSPRASALRPSIAHPADFSTTTSPTRTSEPKQVIFSDGIRPGGELTELDEGASSAPRRSSSSSGRSSRRSRRSVFSRPSTDSAQCMLPLDRAILPPKVEPKEGEEYEGEIFLVNRHLKVHVMITLYKPIAKEVWFFRTEGMETVGQDNLVFLLKRVKDEQQPPRDIFDLIQAVYKRALLGSPIVDLSHIEAPCENFLGRSDLAGFLFFRHTFQSLEGLNLRANEQHLLFGWLFTKWELPWAKLFPLRLLLRLGAETRYYPTPLWCSRDRAHVYKDVANTIIKLLCDFRNYAYSLPIVQGLYIHMQNKRTTVALPNERYRDIVRALNKSNSFVLALGASFSTAADSHLVAIQREDFTASASDYETQAISMINSDRKLTGASFVIFNGALKSSSGLKAKCSIVEDGIMIQVDQERMLSIRKSLEKMDDFTIECGPIASAEPDEVVEVVWKDSPIPTNQGVKSEVDGRSLCGVPSVRLHLGRDFVHERARLLIRWTEVFLLHTSDPEGPDPMTSASLLAKAICSLFVGHLKALKACGLRCLAVRVNLDPDKIGFEAGSGGSELAQDWLNILDAGLVPIIHGGNISGDQALCVELVFHILDA